jgi:peroxidase
MVVIPSNAQLSLDFSNCKLRAMTAIRSVVYEAIKEEKRMGASLLRMHFHDCFVQGCDGSILLDDINGNFTGEKTAGPNKNSVRGFEIIDAIKTKVDNVCGKGKVSCADIIAVAARDSIDILGGPYYSVKVGRKDSKTASLNLANANLPPSASNLSQLLTKFQAQQLNLKDLVALSGAHTIGKGRCINFRNRIYTDGENIDQTYKMTLQNICPSTGEDDNLAACDVTTENSFDTAYYRNLLVKKGLFHSDQELYKGDGSEADALVTKYAKNYLAFKSDFINAMIKMGDLKNTDEGEIRNNCRVVNG